MSEREPPESQGIPSGPIQRQNFANVLRKWLLLPTRRQWAAWSLPSKLSAAGAWIGFVGLILTVGAMQLGTQPILDAELPMLAPPVSIAAHRPFLEQTLGVPISSASIGKHLVKCTYRRANILVQTVYDVNDYCVAWAITLTQGACTIDWPNPDGFITLGRSGDEEFGHPTGVRCNMSAHLAQYSEQYYFGFGANYHSHFAGFSDLNIVGQPDGFVPLQRFPCDAEWHSTGPGSDFERVRDVRATMIPNVAGEVSTEDMTDEEVRLLDEVGWGVSVYEAMNFR